MEKTKSPSLKLIVGISAAIGLAGITIPTVLNRDIRSAAIRSANSLLFDILRETPNYTSTRSPTQIYIPADMDRDFDVDSADYAAFSNCFTGPGKKYTENCVSADFDSDGDVDLRDFAEVQRMY